MLNKIITWFRSLFKSKEERLLAVLLSNPQSLPDFLGVTPLQQLTPEERNEETQRAYRYTHSKEYQAVAKEIWSCFLYSFRIVIGERSSQQSIDFHRARLKTYLEILSLSYQTFQTQKELAEKKSKDALTVAV